MMRRAVCFVGRVARRILCFAMNICPRCEQSMYDPMSGQYWYFCQTKGCGDPVPYTGPERRA